jgi:hypothetical protein
MDRPKFVRLSSLQSCSEYWPSPLSCSGLLNSFYHSKPFELESNHLRIDKFRRKSRLSSTTTKASQQGAIIVSFETTNETKRIESKPPPLIVESFHIERMPRSNKDDQTNSYLMQNSKAEISDTSNEQFHAQETPQNEVPTSGTTKRSKGAESPTLPL